MSESGLIPALPQPGRLDWADRLIIAVALIVSAAVVLNAEPLQSANDRSRWCTVWSLVERGTFAIDDIIRVPGWDTIDKVRHEGRFYSSKPPLLSYLVAMVYWCLARMTGWDLLHDTGRVASAILLLVNVVPFGAALWALARIVAREARSAFTRHYVVMTAAFGTMLTPFLATLNNHTVAATSLVFALAALLRILRGGASLGTYAACGLLSAFACCNELPAALFGVVVFLLLVVRAPRRTLLGFVPAALVPLGAFFWTNYLQTGGFVPFYAYYGTAKYEYVVDGIPSYWLEPQGVDRNLDSPLMYFLHCTIGHHGIVSLSPFVALSIAGWLGVRRVAESPLKTLLWLGMAMTATVLVFYLSRTQNYNYGGVSCALRWSLWLVPFWLLALPPILDRWENRRWFRVASSALLLGSVFSAWMPLSNPWQQPWLFQVMHGRGWIDYEQPVDPLPHPLWTWFASLPEPTGEISRPRISFAGRDARGVPQRFELATVGFRDFEGFGRLYHLELTDGSGRIWTFFVDAVSFRAGRPPEEFLKWPAGPPHDNDLARLMTLLRGLPAARAYQPGRTRYVKTPLRKDAFRCQRAASRVLYQPRGAEPLIYRSDLWLSNEVSFGVVQIEFTLSQATTGEVLARQRWVADQADGLQAADAPE